MDLSAAPKHHIPLGPIRYPQWMQSRIDAVLYETAAAEDWICDIRIVQDEVISKTFRIRLFKDFVSTVSAAQKTIETEVLGDLQAALKNAAPGLGLRAPAGYFGRWISI